MDYPASLDFLGAHLNLEASAGRIHGLSLDSMERLVRCVGDPQLDLRTIHITGTNGKGSTAAILTALLKALGLRVGTYSSPHIDTVRERLAIDGEMISTEEFAAVMSDLARYVDLGAGKPSYFELLTAAALLWFANEAVDVAVVEVGMLGRFDATNVIDSDVAVVTNIRYDHTDGVGEWKRKVASEKAGIVQAGRPLVLGEPAVELRDIFLAECPDPILDRDRDFGVAASQRAVGGQLLDLYGPYGHYDELYLPLFGDYQADNTAVALAAAETFVGGSLGLSVIEEGLGSVRVAGRLEVAGTSPLVLLDGAHNEDAVQALVAAIPELFLEGTLSGRRIVVMGALGPRDPAAVLRGLHTFEPDLLVTCTAPTERAVEADELFRLALTLGFDAEAVPDVTQAVARARSLAGQDDLILVTGSFYILAEARKALGFLELDVDSE